MPNNNPSRSPLAEAQNSGRNRRQALIADYEQRMGCRFVAMVGGILDKGADGNGGKHLLLI